MVWFTPKNLYKTWHYIGRNLYFRHQGPIRHWSSITPIGYFPSESSASSLDALLSTPKSVVRWRSPRARLWVGFCWASAVSVSFSVVKYPWCFLLSILLSPAVQICLISNIIAKGFPLCYRFKSLRWNLTGFHTSLICVAWSGARLCAGIILHGIIVPHVTDCRYFSTGTVLMGHFTGMLSGNRFGTTRTEKVQMGCSQ